MKIIEALKIGQNLLKTMQENCIKVDDCRYIDLLEEYLAMTANKEKKSYIIAFLSEKYSDHAETVARDVLGKSLSEIPTQRMVEITYAFALDVLKDKDEVYSIREYFGL